MRILIVSLAFATLSACASDGAFESAVDTELPKLYEAVYNRNSEAIFAFTSHENELVSKQAWKALISTQVQNPLRLLPAIMEANSPEAWMALALKPVNKPLADTLIQLWKEKPETREGISRIFAAQNVPAAEDILWESLDDTALSGSIPFAMALGRNGLSLKNYPERETRLIEKITDPNSNPEINAAFLWGYYRRDEKLTTESKFLLAEALADRVLWKNTTLEQYIIRLSLPEGLPLLVRDYTERNIDAMPTRAAIELARELRKVECSMQRGLVVSGIMFHTNVHAQLAAIEAAKACEDYVSKQSRILQEEFIEYNRAHPAVRLQAALLHPESLRFRDTISDVVQENPYLIADWIRFLLQQSPAADAISELERIFSKGERLSSALAVRALSGAWPSLDDAKKDSVAEAMKPEILSLILTGDRSQVFLMSDLLEDSRFLGDDEYHLLEKMFARFRLPEDIEVYQGYASLLEKRFKNEAAAFIDSLVMMNYTALNNSLTSAGWDVFAGDPLPPAFRPVDWELIKKLGRNPYFRLKTTLGDILIKLNTMDAPATISAYHSLSAGQKYDSVAFHRVVPNFVIQGGDFETGLGFGGPGFVLPTEANAMEYERGVVGIASAGTDTEGSQFFIMHSWAPHLNGRYTQIGVVVEGMDIVDKIAVGDVIITTFLK